MKRGVLSTILSLLVVVAWTGDAAASNWGAGVTNENWRCLKDGDTSPAEWKSECTAEDENLYVSVDSDIDPTFRQAFKDSVESDYDPIAGFSAIWQGAAVDASTDTRVRSTTFPPEWPWIYTTCSATADFGGGTGYYRWCRRQLILFDPSRLPSSSRFAWAACQEIGHTAGLQHPADLYDPRVTCMDYDKDTGNLDAHDRQHLADCYPRPSPAQYYLTTLCRDYQPPPPPCDATLAPCL